VTAIVTGRIRVRDAAHWQDYVGRVGATIAQYGGEVLFRGRQERVFAGGEADRSAGESLVILKFADAAAAARWHDSPEYQGLVAQRDAGAEVILIGYTATAGAAPSGPSN
jgi:uncharacterized protein (DUF1330 family)